MSDERHAAGEDHEPSEDQLRLGRRLRELRKLRRMSMRDLAAAAGISVSYVSQIEKGAANASVPMLRRLAEVFGVEWLDFYSDRGSKGRVLKKAERPTFSPGGGQVHHAITLPPLLDVEVGVVEYEPGAVMGDSDYTHGDVQEIFVVLKGRFRFTLDGDAFEMSEGDSVEFRSSVPHMLVSIGDETGEALWVTSPPAGRIASGEPFGDAPD